MPLRLKLPAGEKIILNGAVIENSGSAAVLVLHNDADIMRRKEIMQKNEATTPARKIYFTLQCAYIFIEDRANYIEGAGKLMKEYHAAAPSCLKILQKISKNLKEKKYYNALKSSRALLDHEDQRMEVVMQSMDEALKDIKRDRKNSKHKK